MIDDVEIRPGIWLRYGCEPAKLGAALRPAFAPLGIDLACRNFVQQAERAPAGPMRTRLFQWGRRFLSDYDAYGLLDMYGMHLLSTDQARALLPRNRYARWLDVGAGAGDVTTCLAPLAAEMVVTEASSVLRAKLRRRGYQVLRLDLCNQRAPEPAFDVISALNVLDRCARPLSLLDHARQALAADGKLLVSIPLPLRPHVHVGAHTADPEEALPLSHDDWEADATALQELVFTPRELVTERLCRVPYLSRGDALTPLYVLDAAVFVLQRAR